MIQNILKIPVPQSPQETEESLSAGNMYEHNATALQFLPDAAFLQSDYRFYVEFVTVKGVARTEYLSPNEAGAVTVSLPQEITAQMTALCVFNIVQIGAVGKTEQLIKAKKVRLYFSNLENTEKLLDADYAFSVNTLLEAIYNDTFKGDKGDKGDAYVLTSADKTEIAAQMDADFYGLPLFRKQRGTGDFQLAGAGAMSSVRSICVMPSAADTPLGCVKVTVGKNFLAPFLKPEKYTLFLPNTGAYARMTFYLKPNTTYVLSRRNGGISKRCTALIATGSGSAYFCHTSNVSLNRTQAEITTDETGMVYLESTGVSRSEENYAEILKNEWDGLSLTEKESSAVLCKTFGTPLQAVSEDYADSFDFVNGKLTRNTLCISVSEEMLDAEVPLTLTDATHTVYRYRIALPEGNFKASGVTDGFCAEYPTVPTFLTSNAAYADYVKNSGETQGVFFGSADNALYVYSALGREAFCQMLRDRQTAGNPLIMLCCRANAAVTDEEPTALPALETVSEVQISPSSSTAEFAYSADISAVVADLESRITALENTL